MGAITQSFDYKLPKCRSANFVVYRTTESGCVTCQSHNRIIMVDLNDKTLIMSKSGKTSFMDLMPSFGATMITAPDDLITLLKGLTVDQIRVV